MSIRAALSSEARPWQGEVWRVVEAQARVSTMALADTLEEQRILEELVEEVKPAVPPSCRHLHYLLAAPFRYFPAYPHGSRFRRAGQPDGVFYAAERPETAVAEIAFYRLLFLAESPDMVPPRRPLEFTAFSVSCRTGRMIDLTAPPFDADAAGWENLTDYEACQALADRARAEAVEAIRYRSVRDPDQGRNLALLSPRAFAEPNPTAWQTWHMMVRPAGVHAAREFPPFEREYGAAAFGADPRLRGVRPAEQSP